MSAPTSYPFAETFGAPQGEGLYSGVPMRFLRLVGCSVGQTVCTACDTDFVTVRRDLGGGVFPLADIPALVGDYRHVCLTGGEPLDRDLRPLIRALSHASVHVETSGTKKPGWLDPHRQPHVRSRGMHAVGEDLPDGRLAWRWQALWVTVSPKPGYLPEMVEHVADEVKVIIGGLGDGPGWPTVEDAVRWADMGKLVYVQPRNERLSVNRDNLREVVALVDQYPQLRLSCQLHKFINTR
jgi:organic radical activating enzyme